MGSATARLTALRILSGAFLAAAGTGAAVHAQEESTNQVAAETAWSVFEDSDPRECWAVSSPTKTVNTKDGRVVQVRRGEILLMTFYRPDAGVDGQVTFTGGYPFAEDITVNMQIGDDEFELFTEGEWAWPASTEDDAKIIAAMKRGADAVLTALSSRGTTTKDTFSLMGYTAAVEEAEKRCQ
jgi:predicted transglutaminase-like cysteine proteinase